jgi:hypothetical protein
VPERPGDMDERDVDARFASIIARWDGPVPAAGDDPEAGQATSDAVAATPAAGGSDGDGGADGDGGVEGDGGAAAVTGVEPGTDGEPDAGEPAPPATPPSPWVNPSPLDVVVPASAWRAAEPTDPGTEAAAEKAEAALEDDVEHFEPPEVVLPPQEDLHFWGAVAGLVAGPLMLLYVVFARPFHSTRWFVAAVVVSLLGFGLLILRQPKDRDPTSGDDGARV